MTLKHLNTHTQNILNTSTRNYMSATVGCQQQVKKTVSLTYQKSKGSLFTALTPLSQFQSSL